MLSRRSSVSGSLGGDRRPSSSMQVYIPVADGRVWARARLPLGQSYEGGERATVNQEGASVECLLPKEVMFVDSARLDEMEDLCDLDHVHEASILEAVDERTKAGMPYTAAGGVILAVNPFRWIDGLYTKAQRRAHQAGTAKTAHVYHVSAAAARGASRGVDQSILVSGESGSGKTETVKLLLGHLAEMHNDSDDEQSSTSRQLVVAKMLSAGPLLESFGNAATLRNGNSSRFAKFVIVDFDPKSISVLGSRCEVALVEKTRLVEREAGERTFHILYELASEDPELKKRRYLEGETASATEARGKSDSEAFSETQLGLKVLCGDTALLNAVKACLALGDIVFFPDEDEAAEVEDAARLLEAAAALNCDAEALGAGLLQRDVRGVTVHLDVSAAAKARDALATELYARVFDAVVALSNAVTQPSRSGVKSGVRIGLLDMFGFEFYNGSGFAQLLINLANEHLQQRFVGDVLAQHQQEIVAEGVPWEKVVYEDNANVLSLLEAKAINNATPGLVDILNEECVRGVSAGSDAHFVGKLLREHSSHPALSTPKIRKHDEGQAPPFTVAHYAGRVEYCPDGTWVDRNRDVLPVRLQETMFLAAEAEGEDVKLSPAQIFAGVGGRHGKERYHIKGGSGASNLETVASKFRTQLRSMMKRIAATKCRYVRCVRPNAGRLALGQPGAFDRSAVVEQLRCCGVLSALGIARADYPDREALASFVERYAVCASIFAEGKVTSATLLQRCKARRKSLVKKKTSTMSLLFPVADEEEEEEVTLDPDLVRLSAPYRPVAMELLEIMEVHAEKSPPPPPSVLARTSISLSKKQSELASSRRAKLTARVALGRTKVFMRQGVLDELEYMRGEACFRYATSIQRRARGRTPLRRLQKLKKTVLTVQFLIRFTAAMKRAKKGAVLDETPRRERAATPITAPLDDDEHDDLPQQMVKLLLDLFMSGTSATSVGCGILLLFMIFLFLSSLLLVVFLLPEAAKNKIPIAKILAWLSTYLTTNDERRQKSPAGATEGAR